MSGTGDEAPDMDAAEYVIGVLDTAEAAAAERRIAGDTAFAAEIADWERRLMPLTAVVPPVAPPNDLFDRIEASIGAPAANENRRLAWPATAIAAMAVAAGLAAFIVLRPVPPPVVAVLLPASGGAPVLVAVAEPSGRTLVRATSAIPVPSGRDLELWAMKAGATRPESLGVIPQSGREMPASLAPGTMLLVSLEPQGGSATGQPTGPVLYAGKLTIYN
jgi:anti-sigma-K factor RskA